MAHPKSNPSGEHRQGECLHRLAFCFLIIFAALLNHPRLTAAQDLTVAVAANFMLPFGELSRVFEQKSSVKVKAIFSSTGSLYAQIKNGAPYAFFLAADEDRPRLLHAAGLAKAPFTYAKGKAVLWSANDSLRRIGAWRTVVRSTGVAKIAIANPDTAPYGAAAVKALKHAGLWETIQEKLVFAQNVTQVFQYAYTETADAGFCAFSAVFSEQGRKGNYWIIPEAPDIFQAACILKREGAAKPVREFAEFLRSAEARSIKEKYGYE